MTIKHNSEKIILIIGAGISGLAACAQLTKLGFNAKILEARNRAGGRILTDYSLGIPFGRGANWIHGDKNNPVSKLIKNSELKKVIVNPDKFCIFDRYKHSIERNEILKFNQKFQKILAKAKGVASKANKDITLKSAISKFTEQNSLSTLEQDLFDAELLSIESYIGASYDSLSARHWEQGEQWPGDNCFLTSSYQPILDNLAKTCSIQFDTCVERIKKHESYIEIFTNNGDYSCDAVIITVPLGVLKNKKIIFDPPLPTYKQNAIDHLEMATFNITAFKFKESFWPLDNQAMFFTQLDKTSIPVFFNLHHYLQEPIIVGLSGGKRAQKIENISDEEIIEKSLHNFQKSFKNEIPRPQAYINTRWSQDEFSFGSFSYLPPGASFSDFEALAKTISKQIFFAGEATSTKYSATTHGAYLSGIREANKIIKSFKQIK